MSANGATASARSGNDLRRSVKARRTYYDVSNAYQWALNDMLLAAFKGIYYPKFDGFLTLQKKVFKYKLDRHLEFKKVSQ